MSPTRDPLMRLHHILDEAEAIREATSGLGLSAFVETWTVRRAVEHGFLIITEASRSLPVDLKSRYTAVPWQRLESLGNVLRHEYQHVDPRVLWRVVHEQLPTLITTVRSMLAELED